MKLNYSLITRRTFLNTLFFGWIFAFFSGTFYALMRFAFPTLGKEPDFVVLNWKDFAEIPTNSVKRFPWGGTVGLFYKRDDGSAIALKGVCSHMECNVDFRPAERRFYCACHQGWFDSDGRNIAGPPPKPLEVFTIRGEGDKLIIARKGVQVELPKA
jgi:cytochrome b6-f complex iron-sulfur subunit